MKALVVNQALVDRIYAKAKTTNFGICAEVSLALTNYAKPWTPETLALVLVNGFHAKYDLVSIMQATIEILSGEQ